MSMQGVDMLIAITHLQKLEFCLHPLCSRHVNLSSSNMGGWGFPLGRAARARTAGLRKLHINIHSSASATAGIVHNDIKVNQP